MDHTDKSKFRNRFEKVKWQQIESIFDGVASSSRLKSPHVSLHYLLIEHIPCLLEGAFFFLDRMLPRVCTLHNPIDSHTNTRRLLRHVILFFFLYFDKNASIAGEGLFPHASDVCIIKNKGLDGAQ
ncbi:hypothetical protein CDAR_46731 [Caerostris darwini]|uniref:Maturase K n=1 Tax=Caerostris darwini TaxID=1538125 RepID=A0AAV4V6D6_9ARAC|nr:hypothetical protein CDAR_46731 [Caerostris darwini]